MIIGWFFTGCVVVFFTDSLKHIKSVKMLRIVSRMTFAITCLLRTLNSRICTLPRHSLNVQVIESVKKPILEALA